LSKTQRELCAAGGRFSTLMVAAWISATRWTIENPNPALPPPPVAPPEALKNQLALILRARR